jgi:hypothetical protein
MHRLGLLLGRAWPEAIAFTSDILSDENVGEEVVEREIRRLKRRCERHDIPVDGLVDDERDPFMPGDTFPRPRGGYTY